MKHVMRKIGVLVLALSLAFAFTPSGAFAAVADGSASSDGIAKETASAGYQDRANLQVNYASVADAVEVKVGKEGQVIIDCLDSEDDEEYTNGGWFRFTAEKDTAYMFTFGIKQDPSMIYTDDVAVYPYTEDQLEDFIDEYTGETFEADDRIYVGDSESIEAFCSVASMKKGDTLYFYVDPAYNLGEWSAEKTIATLKVTEHVNHNFVEDERKYNSAYYIDYRCEACKAGYTLDVHYEKEKAYDGAAPDWQYDINWTKVGNWGTDLPTGTGYDKILGLSFTRTSVGSGYMKMNFKAPFNKWMKDISLPYTIKARSLKTDAKNVTVSATRTYTGSTVYPVVNMLLREEYQYDPVKDTAVLKKYNKKLVKGTDYTVTSIKNGKSVGKATITIKGKGNFTGSVTKTFKIVPKKAVIDSAAAGTKKMTVKMKTKVSSTGGSTYQIQYRVKGTSKWKSTTATSQSKTIKKLKKGKCYQVRVRAYKSVNGTKYYGDWSAIKTTKKIK